MRTKGQRTAREPGHEPERRAPEPDNHEQYHGNLARNAGPEHAQILQQQGDFD